MGQEDQSLLNEQAGAAPVLPHNPVSPPAGYAMYPPPLGYPMMYPVPVSPMSVESGNAPQYMMNPYPPQYAQYQIPPQYQVPPQYLPQYAAPQQPPQQFDNCKNGSVLHGVTPDNVDTHVPMVQEDFSEQIKRLPKRVMASLNMKLPVYNDLKTYSSWKSIFFLLTLQSTIRFAIALAFMSVIGDMSSFAAIAGIVFVYAYVGTFVSFLLSNGILHGACMCFGGRGNQPGSVLYAQMCYLSAMFSTPMDLAMFTAVIPIVGGVVSLALVAYKLLLYVMTLRSVYGFTSGKAIGIILGLFAVAIIIVLVMYAAIFAAIASDMN
jgi:hypothetical protein